MMEHSNYPKVYLYRRIVQAKLYIDLHFAEKIDLDNISSEANFSKFHFLRLFKKTYGISPHQYLKSVRLDQARKRLAAGASVTSACCDVGFESVTSFIGLFKRAFGITPSAWLLQEKNLKTHIQLAPLKFVPGCFAEAKRWK